MALPAAKPGTTRIGWIGTGVMGRWMCQHAMVKGFAATVFNRTAGKLDALPLDDFRRRDGELVINTLPIFRADADINAVYAEQPAANDGRALLRAQAVRQNELFIEAMQ